MHSEEQFLLQGLMSKEAGEVEKNHVYTNKYEDLDQTPEWHTL